MKAESRKRKIKNAQKREVLGRVSLSFCLLGVLFNILTAQGYFGKNKVQYTKPRFHCLTTAHFYIYYPEGSEKLASFAKWVCDDQAESLEKKLLLKKKDKTPIIIYNSFSSFSQTNVILDLIEEGVGGFAELLKRRVVIPFEGNLSHFERVLRHEVTHIYEYELFFKPRFGFFFQSPNIPLFIMEGFSEYTAGKILGRESFSETYLRDYIAHNQLSLPVLINEEGYLAYRLGEAFFFYIDKKYGAGKVYELLNSLKKKNLSEAIKSLFGKSLPKFSEEFFEHLKTEYFPLYANKRKDSLLNFLTSSPKKGVWNTTPVISPAGDEVLYLSNQRGDFEVYLTDTYSGKRAKRIIKLKRPKEEIRFLKREMTITNFPEKRIALMITKEGRKELWVLSADLKVKKKFPLPLDDAFDPAFSPDGEKLALTGTKDGFSDIYILDLVSGRLERITSDFYEDREASFSQRDSSLIFVSNRPESGESPRRDFSVWSYSKEGVIKKVLGSFPYLRTPVQLSSGELLFIGEGQQIFLADTAGKIYRTNFFTGFDYLSLSRDGKVAMSYFRNLSWEIAVVELPCLRSELVGVEEKPAPLIAEVSLPEEEKSVPAGFSLSADYAQGAMSFSPGVFSGYALITLSDILGDHRFLILTDLTGFIDLSNFYFSYWYLKERQDYNLTLYQLLNSYYRGSNIIIVRNRLISPQVSYPLSKEERVEAGVGFFFHQRWNYDEEGNLIDEGKEVKEIPVFSAYVFDNTLWSTFGPKKGRRMRLEGMRSFWERNYWTTYLDFRYYLSFFGDYSLASKIYSLTSFGRNPDSLVIGGEVVRGYNYYEFYDTTGHFLSSFALEFRFPFIKELRLGLPPLRIGNIGGRLFLDGGFLLTNPRKWQRGTSWFYKFGAGFGLRIYIPPIPLGIDFAYPLSRTDDKSWKINLFLGEEF